MDDIVEWDRYAIFRVMPNGVLGWMLAVSTVEEGSAKLRAFSARDPDTEYFLYDIAARRKVASTDSGGVALGCCRSPIGTNESPLRSSSLSDSSRWSKEAYDR